MIKKIKRYYYHLMSNASLGDTAYLYLFFRFDPLWSEIRSDNFDELTRFTVNVHHFLRRNKYTEETISLPRCLGND